MSAAHLRGDEGQPGREDVVLVVDDAEMVRDLVKNILNDNGYIVLQASSPEAALPCLSDEIRLVISDLNFPGGSSGTEFLENVATLCPGVSRILMSGAFSVEDAKIGRFPLLLKPFRPHELLSLVASLRKNLRDNHGRQRE